MGSRVSSRAIIGREGQLRALDAALAASLDRTPQIALITGEAGVGKTRLIGELEARAREHGFVVLHGEAVEFGGDEFAYAPVIAALRGLPEGWVADQAPEELAALLPRVRRGPAPAATVPGRFGQGRLCELLLELLGRLADDEAPLLVVLEDLHWADRSTRDLVAFLARNLSGERIALGLTYRTGELPADHPLRRLLTELVRRPAVRRLDVAPFGRDDVARQVEAIAGHPVAARSWMSSTAAPGATHSSSRSCSPPIGTARRGCRPRWRTPCRRASGVWHRRRSSSWRSSPRRAGAPPMTCSSVSSRSPTWGRRCARHSTQA